MRHSNLVIANPVAGGGQGRVRAEALCRALEARGLGVTCRMTGKTGDARVFASEAGPVDCIAVVGGDGTLNEVVNGVREAGACIAALPAGSANVVAREFGIPPDAERVASWIAEGRSRPMDLLESEGRRIILGAGAGLDAAIAAAVKARRGSKSSVFKWILPGIQTAWRYTFPGVRVTVDGVVVCEHSPYVVAGNCRYSAGLFPATRRAQVDDGLIDVVALKRLDKWRLAMLLAAVWSPKFPERDDLVYLQGKEVVFEPADDMPVPLQIDGDPAGTVPARFTILPHAIRFVTRPDHPRI